MTYEIGAKPATPEQQSNERAKLLWNQRAVGYRRSAAPKGTPQYFSEMRAYRYGYETPFIPKVFDFAGMAGKRVLEIGVGNGIDAVEMIRHGAIYTGVDITRNHLELTRANVEQQFGPSAQAKLIEGDLVELTLAERFDVVYSFGVLHHIAHEKQMLEKARELLTPDGVLKIAVYANWSFFNIWMNTMWVVRNRMRNPLLDYKSHVCEGSDLGHPVVLKIRSKKEVERLLEGTGFKPVSYSKQGFVQRYIPIFGRFLRPEGMTLSLCASQLGWYHCFTCTRG